MGGSAPQASQAWRTAPTTSFPWARRHTRPRTETAPHAWRVSGSDHAPAFREEDPARERKEADEKKTHREEFGIGWKVKSIPRNADIATRLAFCTVSRGMCCLVFDESSGRVKIASTVEPAAALNLEYLATACQVRRRENREPPLLPGPGGPHEPQKPAETLYRQALEGMTRTLGPQHSSTWQTMDRMSPKSQQRPCTGRRWRG